MYLGPQRKEKAGVGEWPLKDADVQKQMPKTEKF